MAIVDHAMYKGNSKLSNIIHTYKDIYKAPFDQKDTKRYRKRKGGKKARAKEKGNQLIGKKMTFKRLFERGSGGSASDHGREVVP